MKSSIRSLALLWRMEAHGFDSGQALRNPVYEFWIFPTWRLLGDFPELSSSVDLHTRSEVVETLGSRPYAHYKGRTAYNLRPSIHM